MDAQELLSRLHGVTKTASGWSARCPAHEDRQASLSVAVGRDGKVLLHCHAGCSTEAIVAAIGAKLGDLFPPREAPHRRIVSTYTYTDAGGRPLIQVIRYEPKSFARKSPDGRGGWKFGGTGDVAALYHWPELRAACSAGRRVYLVEGEKDVDNLRRAGAHCTTALGGASKWRDAYAAEFVGASDVVVICDRDTAENKYAGQRFGLRARDAIQAAGVKARAVVLPESINGRRVKDVSDAILAGWRLDDIEGYVSSASEVEVPDETPGDDDATSGGAGRQTPPVGSLEAAIAAAVRDAEDRANDEGRALGRDARREALIDAAIDWMRVHGGFYFDIDADDVSGAYYFDAAGKELMRVHGDGFATWLAWSANVNRQGNDYRYLQSRCEDAAMRGDFSRRISPALFWRFENGAIYISNGDGQAVKCTAGGCETVDNGTDGVLFRSGRTCAAWKLLPPGDAVPIWDVGVVGGISVPDNPLAPLLIALWVLALPRDLRNKPPLSLCGDVGSGKTRTARGLYEILGIEERVCSAEKGEKGEEQFWVSVKFGGISTIDNVDSRCAWLPDALAAASTGGQKEKRRLYSDDDLVFLRANSAQIITSANPLYATDAGLADRLINVMFVRPDSRASSDSDLTAEIVARRDGIMTWIARTCAAALAVQGDPPAGLNRRHPDWAAWAWRCGVALGLREETERVLSRAEADKARVAICADPLYGSVIYRIMQELGEPLDATSAELVAVMTKGTGGSLPGNNGLIVPPGRVIPEDYGVETRDKLVTPRRVGIYIARHKHELAEVFGLSSRVVHGETWWRFNPPAADPAGWIGGFKTPFFNFPTRGSYLKGDTDNYIGEVKIGGSTSTNPPNSTPDNGDDGDGGDEEVPF